MPPPDTRARLARVRRSHLAGGPAPVALRAVSFLALIVVLAIALGVVPAAWAGRPVQVYMVTVRAGESDAIQDAMRQALVRATGRQDAATDPAFAALVAHASDYVRATQPAGDGLLEVSFDGAAVERQIAAAGRSVWDPTRPFTLVVLSPAPTGAADDETRRELEQVGEQRGLPIALVPMPVADQNGNPLSADVLLTKARRLGGDAVLLGRADPQSEGLWQWTLITGLATQSWDGSLDAGVNGAVDALARVEGRALPLTEEEARVRISGVTTLADYAAVERTFEELPGARRSGLEEADGTTATFRVLIRGGAAAIERALASSQHFTRIDAGPARGEAAAEGAPVAAPIAADTPRAGAQTGAQPGPQPGAQSASPQASPPSRPATSVQAAPLAYQYHP